MSIATRQGLKTCIYDAVGPTFGETCRTELKILARCVVQPWQGLIQVGSKIYLDTARELTEFGLVVRERLLPPNTNASTLLPQIPLD